MADRKYRRRLMFRAFAAAGVVVLLLGVAVLVANSSDSQTASGSDHGSTQATTQDEGPATDSGQPADGSQDQTTEEEHLEGSLTDDASLAQEKESLSDEFEKEGINSDQLAGAFRIKTDVAAETNKEGQTVNVRTSYWAGAGGYWKIITIDGNTICSPLVEDVPGVNVDTEESNATGLPDEGLTNSDTN